MTHQMNGQQLQKALEMLAEVVSPLKKEETVLERPSDALKKEETILEMLSDGDLLYYDNASMMEKLKVSERTLQRYRKNGKIRHTTFGGKIYYLWFCLYLNPKFLKAKKTILSHSMNLPKDTIPQGQEAK